MTEQDKKAENEKSDKDAVEDGSDTSADASPPEVEAELVSASDTPREQEPSTPELGDLSDSGDSDAFGNTETAPKADDARGMSPGMMLSLVFGAFVILAALIWGLNRNSSQDQVASEKAEQTTAALPAAAEDVSDGAEEIVEPHEETHAVAGNEINEDDASLAVNEDTSEEENVATPQAATDAPVTGSRAAIAALNRMAEGRNSNPDTGGAAVNDASPGPQAAAVEPTETPEEVGAPAAPAANPPASSAAIDPKVQNEIAELKALFRERTDELSTALDEERARSAEQAGEIRALRDAVQQALIDRDRRAEQDITDLRTRLDKIQNAGSGATAEGFATDRGAAATLALMAVERVMKTGEPFEGELGVLSSLLPNNPSIAILEASASGGVPTLSALSDRFDPTADAAVAAAARASAGGAVEKLVANIRNTVTVRPTEPQDGDTPVAIISRAEYFLGEGDLAKAVSELKTLSGAPADAFGTWLVAAENHLRNETAINAIRSDLLAHIE